MMNSSNTAGWKQHTLNEYVSMIKSALDGWYLSRFDDGSSDGDMTVECDDSDGDSLASHDDMISASEV